MAKAVRMADIAERLGVSTVTVSKALGGKKGVGEALRAKILATAAEMGYEETKSGQSQTGNIGILIPQRFLHQSQSFYWVVYQQLLNYLQEENYYGILEVLGAEQEEHLLKPRMLSDSKIDGIIVVGQQRKDYFAYLCANSEVPLVFLDTNQTAANQSYIISDGYYGMYTMTEYLISMGHKDIFFVGSREATSSILDRYYGYCRAMYEHGYPVTPDMILPDREPDGRTVVTLGDRLPTAYACNCDVTACAVIARLKQQGLKVPDDISVVGFDNYLLPGYTGPAITTYTVDINRMAREAVNLLRQRILNPKQTAQLKVVCGHILVRNTVNTI